MEMEAVTDGLKTVGGPTVSMDDCKFKDLRSKAISLKDNINEGYWALSDVLCEIYEESRYIEWGYSAFPEYVDEELDFGLRKAQYLASTSKWMKTLKPAPKKWAQSLGWSKAKELVGIVDNDNFTIWRKRLDGKSLRDVITVLKAANNGDDPDAVIEGMDDKGSGGEKAAKKMFALFPDQMDNVTAAIEKAKLAADSDKEGNALDLIATEYLATHVGEESQIDYLKRVERMTGLRIFAYSHSEENIIYGAELIDELIEQQEE